MPHRVDRPNSLSRPSRSPLMRPNQGSIRYCTSASYGLCPVGIRRARNRQLAVATPFGDGLRPSPNSCTPIVASGVATASNCDEGSSVIYKRHSRKASPQEGERDKLSHL